MSKQDNQIKAIFRASYPPDQWYAEYLILRDGYRPVYNTILELLKFSENVEQAKAD